MDKLCIMHSGSPRVDVGGYRIKISIDAENSGGQVRHKAVRPRSVRARACDKPVQKGEFDTHDGVVRG